MFLTSMLVQDEHLPPYLLQNLQNYGQQDIGTPFVTNADAFVVGEHFPDSRGDLKDFGRIH